MSTAPARDRLHFDDILNAIVTLVALAIFILAFTFQERTIHGIDASAVSPATMAVAAPQGPSRMFLPRPDTVDSLFHIDDVRLGTQTLFREITAGHPPLIRAGGGDTLIVQGWAIDPTTRLPPSYVVAETEGGQLLVSPDEKRPDVQAGLKLSDAALTSGYTLRFPLAALSKGRHTVHFILVGSDGRRAFRTRLAVNVFLTTAPSVNGPGPFRTGAVVSTAEAYYDLIDQQRITDLLALQHVGSGPWRLTGWAAADPNAGHAFRRLLVRIDGRLIATVSHGSLRPDVGVAFRHPEMSNSGFVVNIAAGKLRGSGEHRLTLYVVPDHGAILQAQPSLRIAP